MASSVNSLSLTPRRRTGWPFRHSLPNRSRAAADPLFEMLEIDSPNDTHAPLARELAAEIGATSADHLAAVSDAGLLALRAASTVATLLPGTMMFLGKPRHAPARAMIDGGVPVALATDFNPGTSPTTNFPLILTLAVSQLRMSVGEAIVAATVNGAAALSLAGQVGQLAPGFSADLALFEIDDVRELPYWYGDHRLLASWTRGKPCHVRDLGVRYEA